MSLRIQNEIDWLVNDETGVIAGYQRNDGVSMLPTSGPVISGDWMPIPERLRLVGTGTAVMDARNSAGVVTEGVDRFEAIAASEQIEYPYEGENAVEVRITITGELTMEVI